MAPKATKPKALIVLGDGHDHIKQGVRLRSDTYFDKAAEASFAPYTKDHAVTIVHVTSAQHMKQVIEGGTWNVVIYFGHGVENMAALAPKEKGAVLKKEDLVTALQAAKVHEVYFFGCKAGWTGLARAVSKSIPGAKVHGTFGSLDVEWEQSMDKNRNFTNKFTFKEPLTEYTGGFQTKDGKKVKQRRVELTDPRGPIKPTNDPLGVGEDMIDQ